jgi:hypothetical protein
MKKTLRALLDAVAEQRAKSSPEGDGDYCLHYGDLDRVEHFLLSFDEPGALKRNQPAVAELAERLAKVEDRLAQLKDVEFSLTRIANLARIIGEHKLETNQRIDKVAEIIGERVSGLVDELEELKNWAWGGGPSPRQRIVAAMPKELRDAFPTGGAGTAEAATDAVLPVPQRGDRVRLEGATSTGQTHLKDGWYDVTGFHEATAIGDNDQFQVGTPNGGLYWLYIHTSALKEVRHADHA